MAFATSLGGNKALFLAQGVLSSFCGKSLKNKTKHVSDVAKKLLPIVVQKQKDASWHVPFTTLSAILHCIDLLPYSDKCFVTHVE